MDLTKLDVILILQIFILLVLLLPYIVGRRP